MVGIARPSFVNRTHTAAASFLLPYNEEAPAEEISVESVLLSAYERRLSSSTFLLSVLSSMGLTQNVTIVLRTFFFHGSGSVTKDDVDIGTIATDQPSEVLTISPIRL